MIQAACCPPNLARTLGIIGGYTWNAIVQPASKRIVIAVYLYIPATRTITLPGGQTATIIMETSMPWKGSAQWTLEAPAGWSWELSVPKPAYADRDRLNASSSSLAEGFSTVDLPASSTLTQTFEMPVRLLAPHPCSEQDTLTVSRGPIIYVAEAIDNEEVERAYPHFHGVGLSSSTTFNEEDIDIESFTVLQLSAKEVAYGIEDIHTKEAYRVVNTQKPARTWRPLAKGLVFAPWFARGNRGGNGHIRTSMLRVD